jgi:hypothetical protein
MVQGSNKNVLPFEMKISWSLPARLALLMTFAGLATAPAQSIPTNA